MDASQQGTAVGQDLAGAGAVEAPSDEIVAYVIEEAPPNGVTTGPENTPPSPPSPPHQAAPGGDGGRGSATTSANGGDGGGDGNDGDGAKMTLYEHIAELRTRLFICVVAIVVTAIAGWFLYNPVLKFMTESYHSFCHHHPGRTVSCNLLARTPTEGFLTRLQLAFYIGIVLAAPVWIWELWRFITPGLKKNEKRYALPYLFAAVSLFSMGVALAVLVWPKALNWLISVGGTNVSTAYSISSYVNLYTLVCLVFGAVFLYPIIVVSLMITGVVPTAKWRKWRRPAIVVLCAVAAIVTPSNDPFTFAGMAVPMIVFYELSIILGRLLKK
jgi:sec-independent protein translocase protein TatC